MLNVKLKMINEPQFKIYHSSFNISRSGQQK
jgi:hypothetical protein